MDFELVNDENHQNTTKLHVHVHFKYRGQEICTVSTYKYLGVYLDEHI